ncbi:hypothetical protein Ahy_B01g051912 [Arachis hypogaea]|uniref:Serine-threonine/tyrosine-protein kinase catalytic domain-containing protein n=1 Tax=Arachis hypogaea TaxID=3818 RepID=A0A445ANB4_ARAHY|nr:hypothetical protein Ahy_B01g051912 [Arachis hypogaea]
MYGRVSHKSDIVEEFVNEVVIISRTSHLNIISVLGFCYAVNKQCCSRIRLLTSKIETPGYIALEMFGRMYGGASHKSYVYSYGILILEMIREKKNYDTE